jgi:hypothetical protein
MKATLPGLRAELTEALDQFDVVVIADLVGRIVDTLYRSVGEVDRRAVRGVLDDLRRQRHHGHVARIAEAAIRTGDDRPAVRRRYVQSLLDRGLVAAAVDMAERQLSALDAAHPDAAELRGLLGRAHKDVALSLRGPERRHVALQQAVSCYLDAYLEDDRRWWHGVNAAALLALAQREGVQLHADWTASQLGERLLAAVEDAGDEPSAWACATAMEAALATRDADAATRWLMHYIGEARGDAFALASTLRQVTEVWQLRPHDPPGDQLIPPLQAALLRAEGGTVHVPIAEAHEGVADHGLEALFGPERYQDVVWFQRGLERCRSVGRVDDSGGDGIGTGFLVDTSMLGRRCPDLLFMTNAHVLSTTSGDALRPDQAMVTFSALEGDGVVHRIRSVIFESPPDALDCALVELATLPDDARGLAMTGQPPMLSEQRRQRAYVIGHPARRRQPQFSIRDNFLVDLDDRLVHYRSPTEPGSSGSPVFNEEWQVFALHHRGHQQMPRLDGRGTYQANAGIRLDAIVAACRDQLG